MKLQLQIEEVRELQSAQAPRQGCALALTRRQGVQNQPCPLPPLSKLMHKLNWRKTSVIDNSNAF